MIPPYTPMALALALAGGEGVVERVSPDAYRVPYTVPIVLFLLCEFLGTLSRACSQAPLRTARPRGCG